MKKVFYRVALTLFCVLITSLPSEAQFKWELGSFLGLTNYLGDFAEDIPVLKESHFAFGVQSRYNFSYQLAVRGGIIVGKISGNDLNAKDPGRRSRGGSFSSILKEFSIMMEWEPMGARRYLAGPGFTRSISPYVFAGLGFVLMDPKTKYSESSPAGLQERIRQDENANYFENRFSIPMGGGIRIDLAEYWSIGVEMGMRYSFTDYLDGMSIAGNPDRNDWYGYTGLSLFYRLKNSRTSFRMRGRKRRIRD